MNRVFVNIFFIVKFCARLQCPFFSIRKFKCKSRIARVDIRLFAKDKIGRAIYAKQSRKGVHSLAAFVFG